MEAKTIQEWFNELGEPYRTQAMKNTKKDNLMYDRNSLSQAILGAFYWLKTDEGYVYWMDLYDTILDAGL